MFKFFNDSKGAVTIFVTLLLIPAILISGTAVDLARIHTAQSIVHDANQLAANSVLTQYDALLKDMYGLYAVMGEDPILADMINEYIKVAIFGEDSSKGLGTFQLFYGSNLQSNSALPIGDQNLRNSQILRRQVEEYAKFRAPVIIVEEILGFIDSLEKIGADTKVIEKKMEVDEKVAEIDNIYDEIYKLINRINTYPGTEDVVFVSVNQYLDQINNLLKELDKTREEWINAFGHDIDGDETKDLESKYNELKNNMIALVKGGNVGRDWVAGDYNGEGEWVDGKWDKISYREGLEKTIDNGTKELENYLTLLDDLIKMCKNADKKKKELSEKIDDLENELEKGNCSQDLADGITKPSFEGENSIIDEYKNLFKYELEPMAKKMYEENGPHINTAISIIGNVCYGDFGKGPFISLKNLKEMPDHIFGIDIIIDPILSKMDTITLKSLAEIEDYTYFKIDKFIEFQGISKEHSKFYNMLKDLYDNENEETDKRKSIRKILKAIREMLKDTVPEDFSIGGARFYKNETNEAFGLDDDEDWKDEKSAFKGIKNSLNKNIIQGMADDGITNKILLVTYAAEMFSNYTTETDTITMAGIPMNADVNYFFQSELEYIYNRNPSSAKANIATVCSMIFLIRFIFNYVSTFIIEEIQIELDSISAVAGPYAIVLRELARFGFAAGESVVDMKNIIKRPSEEVPLIKMNIGQWSFSLGALIEKVADKAVKNIQNEIDLSKPGDIEAYKIQKPDTSINLKYIDYVRILLLLKNEDKIAGGIADLIEFNLTNKKEIPAGQKGNGYEEIMSNTKLIEMETLHTDFEITTTVDLRMLFLSMPFAQKGIKKVIPPKTIQITAIDYRGY